MALEATNPAYNNINIERSSLTNTKGAKIFKIPVLGSLISSALTSHTAHDLEKKAKNNKIRPLKSAENIQKMFLQDSKIEKNLQEVFPTFKGKDNLAKLTEELIRKKVSNLTLARHITRAMNSIEGEQFVGNTQLTEYTEEELFDEVKENLLENKLVSEDFTKNDYDDILMKYFNPSEWVPAGQRVPSPQRLSMRVLFPPEYVYLLVSIEEVKESSPNASKEDFQKKLYQNLEQSMTRGGVEKNTIDRILNQIAYINYDFIQQNPLPYSLIFGGRPTHIANTMKKYGPYLHHAMFFSGNIVLEQKAQLPPEENLKEGFFVRFVHLKYMFDYLKAVRDTGTSVFIIPYKDAFSDETLRKRALWVLGRHPNYDYATENCESVPGWIFENNTALPSMCRTPLLGSVPLSKSSGLMAFWKSIFSDEGFQQIPQFQSGGYRKTRKHMSNKKRAHRMKK